MFNVGKVTLEGGSSRAEGLGSLDANSFPIRASDKSMPRYLSTACSIISQVSPVTCWKFSITVRWFLHFFFILIRTIYASTSSIVGALDFDRTSGLNKPHRGRLVKVNHLFMTDKVERKNSGHTPITPEVGMNGCFFGVQWGKES